MILGGSTGQIGAIKAAKELGFKTLVLDVNPNAIGFKHADYVEVVSTTNKFRAEKLAREYNISGVMTMSSDIAVPTACYINEKLGLSNQGENISEAVTDKAIMREAFKRAGVSTPSYFYYLDGENLEEIKIQVLEILNKKNMIVKPSDSSGSRGVSVIKDIVDLDNAVKYALSFTRNNKVVIEEFIEGIEIGAQCFSIDGKMELCFVHNDSLSSNMVPVGHSFPSKLSEKELADVKSECDQAIKSLGIQNGPSNIDIIIDKKGIPYIIEIGARIGATKLPELVKYHTGIDLIKLTILLSMGEDVVIPSPSNIPVAAQMLYFEKSLEVNYKRHLINSIIELLEPLEYNIELVEGKQDVKSLKSGIDAYGFIIFEGQTVNDAEKKCNEIIDDIKLMVTK